jgi:hypothetical protein
VTPVLLLFTAAATTLVITEGSIFRPIREHGPKLWRDLWSCPLCLGVWIGWAFALVFGSTEFQSALDVQRVTLRWIEWIFGCGMLTGVLAYLAKMVLDVLDALDTRQKP